LSNFVEIANSAATWIGTQGGIVDPDDNRLLARTVRQVWDLQRRSTLRDGEWNFACGREGLPALAGTPPYGFSYWYQMPALSLRLLELVDDPRADYRLEGGKILTDSGAPLQIRYIKDVVEPAQWDETFADAFAKRIAWHIGRRIAGSAYDMVTGERIYRAAIGAAKSVDGRENPPIEQEESSWVTARFGGSSVDMSRID
jgi:hypothetical protein